MMKNLLLLLMVSFSLVSCQKEEVKINGDLEITIVPLVSENNNDTEFCYLYVYENYNDKSVALEKKEVRGARNNKDGSVTVFINKLNPGNYIFKYYALTGVKISTIQVVAGNVKKYSL